MSKVFVPSLRYKNVDGNFVPAADLSPATAFGKLVYLTTPGNNPVNDMAIDQVIEGISGVTRDDFILLTGDTVLTSIALGEMAGRLGMIRVLRWNGRDGNYVIEEWNWEPYIPEFDEGRPQEEVSQEGGVATLLKKAG